MRSCLFSETYCGGYSGEDPPLPIPNREVKLTIADGTAPPGGRVGSCHFLIRHPVIMRWRGVLLYGKATAFYPGPPCRSDGPGGACRPSLRCGWVAFASGASAALRPDPDMASEEVITSLQVPPVLEWLLTVSRSSYSSASPEFSPYYSLTLLKP